MAPAWVKIGLKIQSCSYCKKSGKTAFHLHSADFLSCSSFEEEKGSFGFSASSRGRRNADINKRHVVVLNVQSKQNRSSIFFLGMDKTTKNDQNKRKDFNKF